jgi:glyoxylase-like metal-dependent hydrolase (beta-lactamase superfamily II)
MSSAIRVLAPNPGPFTLEGTNTWIVGSRPALVIDPGPDDPGHVAEILRAAVVVEAILLTHRHPDHAPGAARLAAESGASILAFRPEPGEEPLREGQVIGGGGVDLTVVHTPGHTDDHVVFHDPAFGSMFTGDVVLGRGTSIVDPPEGDMAAYIQSLERLRDLSPRVLYPGHGPAVWDAPAKLQEYVEHRRLRERQVLEGLRAGPRAPQDLVPAIYADYPEEVHPAAARSLLAHLIKLEREGRVRRASGRQDLFSLRNRPAERIHGSAASPGSGAGARNGSS